MQDAKTVLEIVHERGKRGLPLEDVYRMLYNPHLYLLAYGRLYSNKGAMTAGVTGETVDGMSLEKIRLIIDAIRNERYRWKPCKRVYRQKKSGGQRPLGMPVWSDKLVQEVMRLILEAYYEPQFSPHSHAYRPKRGCHTALTAIERPWTGTIWFIEGDIKGCFDNIDHEVLLSILAEKIQDNRFLRLLSYMLKAGYLENWKYHATYSGAPQGSVISPILSNIYLDRMDKYVERELIPAYNRGQRRKPDPAYTKIERKIRTLREKGKAEDRELIKLRRTMPSRAPEDPEYRRLRYIRYADDFLLSFVGPKAEAQEIKEKLRQFLRDNLKLEMSENKTLITHAKTEKARFLGYELYVGTSGCRIDQRGRRSINGQLILRVPRDVVDDHVQKHMANGEPASRAELESLSDYTIVRKYQAEYRGLVQYYLMARNVHALSRYHWVMETSLLKTLANKHKTTVTRIADKLKATRDTPTGPLKVLRVTVPRGQGRKPLVAEFGGISLRKQAVKEIHDTPYIVWAGRSDPVKRLLKQECEMCGRKADELMEYKPQLGRIVAHHKRKLASIKPKGRREPADWMKRMIALRRKTLIVCVECHANIHAGRPCRSREEKGTKQAGMPVKALSGASPE